MNKDLFVLAEISSSFTDVSQASRDFLRDNINLTFDVGDKLFIGLYKPFNAAYLELLQATSEVSVSFKYSNASSFQSLEVFDDTKGFSRSGFLQWKRNIDAWQEVSINSQDAYWVEIEFNEAYTLDAAGFNLVFSDDYEMQTKNASIMDYLAKSDTSFIRTHVATRNEIVQLLRNGGHLKMPSGIDDFFFEPVSNREDITKWDILDINQIKEAATFKSMATIFFNESRNNDDKEYQNYRDYNGRFGQSFKLFYLSLDKNDDGKEDDGEKLASNEILVTYT